MMPMTISSSLWNKNRTTSRWWTQCRRCSWICCCSSATTTTITWMLGPRHLIMNYRSVRDDASTWIIWSSWICVGVSRSEKRKSTRYVLWRWWDGTCILYSLDKNCLSLLKKIEVQGRGEGLSIFERIIRRRWSRFSVFQENGKDIFSFEPLKVTRHVLAGGRSFLFSIGGNVVIEGKCRRKT